MESSGPYQDTEWDILDVISVFRAEKKSSAYETIDYTVLSVAVATLGLVLFVELIRHKFDELARGRPFFKELIACVNSELATLGIVEFVLFIIQKYYTGLNKAQKQVFADVHFMLFYCALFNAIESAILAINVFWVAERTWVRTELLELAHYIEIREEFERVDAILYGETHKKTEFVLEYNIMGLVLGLRELWQRVYRFVRYPILSRRRRELLMQVRFHDLRVHFLKANNLPLQLHVSDYLKRSLLQKLKRLVHISAVAWLLLTGVVNLVYFLMGIVVYVTGDVSKVAYSLAWIFLSSMVFFVLLSLMTFNKMNWIFNRIMRMKLINESANSVFKSGMSIRKGEKEVQNQSELFWGGNPNYIIVAIQFSQFGFALALSILLVFWDDINVNGNPAPSYAYLVTVFACYGTFVLVIAQVFPRYTLCTSLGQLVNKKHLQETLAKFHLEESHRKRQQLLDEQDDEFFETEAFNDVLGLGSLNNGIVTLSDQSKMAEKPAKCKSSLLADLVQTDTHTLRSSLPVKHSVQNQRAERNIRRKTASEDVAFMCQMSGTPPLSVPKTNIPSAPIVRQKTKSSSTAIQQMKEYASPLVDLVQIDTHSLRSAMSIEHSAQNQRAEKKMRRKTLSDGVASLREMSGTKLPPLSVPKSNIRPALQRMKEAEHDLSQPTRKSSSGSSLTRLSESSMPDNVEAIEQQRNQAVRESSSSSELRGLPEDQLMLDQAPTLHSSPRIVKSTSSAASLLPPSSKESTVEVTESSVALPQLENASDSDDSNGIVDIPRIDIDNTQKKASEPEKCRLLYDAVHDYFLGPKYPVISAVFGTLGVFFVIGQRIEGLLLATGALANLENTWQFQPVVSFWWETSYLCCFIVASFFTSIIFRPGRVSTNRKRALFLAGILDVMLSGGCLVLLMIAEAQRCYCAEEESDMADCCAPFGSRSNGGIGKIEPITSIIVLRLFRFSFAHRVIKLLDKWIEWPNAGIAHGEHDLPHEKHHHGHHGGHSADPHDALVGMWQAAINMYPDVVEEHGEFSSELLQAMLGIRTVEDPAKRRVSATRQEESVTLDIDVSREKGSVQAPQNAGRAHVSKRVLHRRKSEENHTSLSSEAQSCIVGGKDRLAGSPATAPMAPSEDYLNEEQFFFINPSAKLLRSMQRCDRKLLPLIDRWTVVDLVITKHEIVYFDASNVDDPSSTKYSPDAWRTMELTRQSLRATKGGKGLRLRDVAAGRKVVGHLAISAVDSVHVERLLPHEEDAKRLDAEEHIERQDKFWEVNETTVEHFAKNDLPCREARWAKLKEDHLLIRSVYGTLCFRFYSDLKDAEAHRDRCLSEREETGSLFKNNALLWCQTVVRLCKRAQLKQKLDHYGDGDDEELRDYLRVIDPKKEAHYRVLGKLRGRASDLLQARPSFRRGESQRNIDQSDDLETATIHIADNLLRVEDCV